MGGCVGMDARRQAAGPGWLEGKERDLLDLL